MVFNKEKYQKRFHKTRNLTNRNSHNNVWRLFRSVVWGIHFVLFASPLPLLRKVEVEYMWLRVRDDYQHVAT